MFTCSAGGHQGAEAARPEPVRRRGGARGVQGDHEDREDEPPRPLARTPTASPSEHSIQYLRSIRTRTCTCWCTELSRDSAHSSPSIFTVFSVQYYTRIRACDSIN